MQGISRRRFTLALCGLSLVGIPTAAATRPRTEWTSQQGDIAERILRREIESGIVPGIGYSIGDSEQTLAEGAFGLRRASPPTPIDIETRFALASVSKQFAAACIFLLRDKGALSLDSPVGDYLPEYRHAQKMTLRQILTMGSGIPMDTKTCERPVGTHMDAATLIDNLNQRELDLSPGN